MAADIWKAKKQKEVVGLEESFYMHILILINNVPVCNLVSIISSLLIIPSSSFPLLNGELKLLFKLDIRPFLGVFLHLFILESSVSNRRSMTKKYPFGPFSNASAPPWDIPRSLIIFGCTSDARNSASRARSLQRECGWACEWKMMKQAKHASYLPCSLDIWLWVVISVICLLEMLDGISCFVCISILLLFLHERTLLIKIVGLSIGVMPIPSDGWRSSG